MIPLSVVVRFLVTALCFCASTTLSTAQGRDANQPSRSVDIRELAAKMPAEMAATPGGQHIQKIVEGVFRRRGCELTYAEFEDSVRPYRFLHPGPLKRTATAAERHERFEHGKINLLYNLTHVHMANEGILELEEAASDQVFIKFNGKGCV